MLEVNREALKWRGLLRLIEECEPDGRIIIRDGRLYYGDLQLDHDAEVKAEIKLIDTILLHGFGIGNALRKLRKAHPDTTTVVLESNPCIIKKVLEYEDMSDLLNDKRLILVILEDDKLERIVGELITRLQSRLYWGDLIQFTTPNYDKVDFYDLKKVMRALEKAVLPILLNRNTLINRSREITENAIKNTPNVIRGTSVDRLTDHFKDKPAVVVASGPSLSKNVEFLKTISNKALLIAVDSVLSVLDKYQIKPDFVCGVDYQAINEQKYSVLFKKKEPVDMVYVFSEGVYYSLPKIFKTGLMSYTGIPFANLYLDIIGKPIKPRFQVNAVTHLAVQLAYILGANPIIFVGQDWAYSGGMDHAKGASIEGRLPEQIKWVKGNYEDKVPTDPNLYSGLKLMEDITRSLSATGVRFVNATEGGAYIENTEVMTLREAAEKYLSDPIDKTIDISDLSYQYEPFIERTEKIRNKIEEIIREASKALAIDKRILKTWKATGKESDIKQDVETVNRINDKITYDEIFQKAVSNFFFKDFYLFNKEEFDISGQSTTKRIEQSIRYFKLIRTKSSEAKRFIDELYMCLVLENRYRKDPEGFIKNLNDVERLLEIYFNFRDIYMGIGLVEKAMALHGDKPSLYYWKAKLCSLNRFMHRESLELFEKALKLDPGFKRAKHDYEVQKNIVVSHLILARDAAKKKQFVHAKRLVQRALEHDPDNEDVKRWMRIIDELSKTQKSAERQKILFEQLKMEEDAFKEYEEVIKLAGEQKLSEAYEKLLALYEKHGAFGEIPFLLGSIMIDKGRFEEAERYLKEALELIPYQPLVYVALGKLNLLKENYFDAKENLEKALGREPKLLGEIGDALGNLYYEFGEYEKAIKVFESYLPYSPDKKRTVLKIALCYKELGMINEYNVLMEKLNQLDSAN